MILFIWKAIENNIQNCNLIQKNLSNESKNSNIEEKNIELVGQVVEIDGIKQVKVIYELKALLKIIKLLYFSLKKTPSIKCPLCPLSFVYLQTHVGAMHKCKTCKKLNAKQCFDCIVKYRYYYY